LLIASIHSYLAIEVSFSTPSPFEEGAYNQIVVIQLIGEGETPST